MFRLVFFAAGLAVCLGKGFTSEASNATDRSVHIPPTPYLLEMEVYEHGAYVHHCDGAIVSARYALTAAQCTHGKNPHLVRFRNGNEWKGVGGWLHHARRLVAHEQYNPSTADYNIALVEVVERFELRLAIPLSWHSPLVGSQASASGFGVSHDTNSRPSLRQQATFPVLNHQACTRLMAWQRFKVTDRMLCAGHLGHGKTDCGGDVGAPLVYKGCLVGVATTEMCGSDAGTMGIFACVESLSKWIAARVSEV